MRWTCWIATALLGGALAWAPAWGSDYRVEYHVAFEPDRGIARVRIDYRPGEGRVSEFDFNVGSSRYRNASADGALEVESGRMVWNPPAEGGSLAYEYRVERRRRDAGYDARMTQDWVLLRGDHLVPAAVVTSSRGAASDASLHVELPSGWSAVETGWPRRGEDNVFTIDNPERRFDRPTGWMIAGDLGIRREQHRDVDVVVAAPRGDGMRRNEILGMTNLVLPEMRDAFGELPEKLLIVGAGDPMWRGGLSGPNSLYMHSARPLISENATSTLVHELVHMVTRIQGNEEHWIAEGTAEFYSLELMRRVGLISHSRFERALDWMRNHGKDVRTLRDVRSHGPKTARAVVLFHDLDREIREASDGERDLDDLMRRLIEVRIPGLHDLREAAEGVIGRPATTLDSPLLN
jgi:predicted metalloprotease with PDZ domain